MKKEGLCDAKAYCATTLGNAELFSQCFGIGVENLPPNQHSFPVCNKHKMKYYNQILAFDKCLVHVGNKVLKGEAILLLSVFDMFLKEYKTDLLESEPNDSTKRSRWLLSALSTALCDHMDIHRTTGRRLGLLLFRKGSNNPLDILHSFMFKVYRDV